MAHEGCTITLQETPKPSIAIDIKESAKRNVRDILELWRRYFGRDITYSEHQLFIEYSNTRMLPRSPHALLAKGLGSSVHSVLPRLIAHKYSRQIPRR